MEPANNPHSLLAPSAASRWMACPPSALLAEKMGEDRGSSYAAEGSLAHRMAELYLTDHLLGRRWMAEHKGQSYFPTVVNPEGYAAAVACTCDPLYQPEMKGYVKTYTDHVIGVLAGDVGAQLHVEAQVPLFYRPGDSGTIDALIYGGEQRTLHVIDLKYGKGVRVGAEGNKQLLCYAGSAYRMLADTIEIDRVEMTIVQPRLDAITSWALDVADLEFECDLIEARAKLAAAGGGEFHTGDHCRFCPVKPRCRALKDEAAKIASTQFEDPALLSDAEIARLLGTIGTVADWITSVKEYALRRAVEGVEYAGYKLVAGVSRRKIVDEKGLLASLTGAGYEPALLQRTSFVTLGELEKIVDKADYPTCCAPYIDKPEAPPVLVEATDPRPEYRTAAAMKDFEAFL